MQQASDGPKPKFFLVKVGFIVEHYMLYHDIMMAYNEYMYGPHVTTVLPHVCFLSVGMLHVHAFHYFHDLNSARQIPMLYLSVFGLDLYDLCGPWNSRLNHVHASNVHENLSGKMLLGLGHVRCGDLRGKKC